MSEPKTSKAKKTATWVSICVACVGAEEGVRYAAYKDPVGIPTICFGETKGVKLGDTATPEQCREMLGDRVLEFGRGVDACTKGELPPARKAALTSFAYNVGVETYCRSSVARKLNAGDVQGGCDALLLYVYAKGIKLPGLVTRRENERAMCLQS